MCRYIPYINLSHIFIAHMSYSEIPIAHPSLRLSSAAWWAPTWRCCGSGPTATAPCRSCTLGMTSMVNPPRRNCWFHWFSTSNHCLSPQVITKHGWLVVTSPNMAGKSAIFTAMLSMDDDENHAVIVKSQRNSKTKTENPIPWKSPRKSHWNIPSSKNVELAQCHRHPLRSAPRCSLRPGLCQPHRIWSGPTYCFMVDIS